MWDRRISALLSSPTVSGTFFDTSELVVEQGEMASQPELRYYYRKALYRNGEEIHE
jgi:hypothetical protein